MIRQLLISFVFLASATAFMVPMPSAGRMQIQVSMSSSTETSVDAFDTYEVGNPQQELAIRDVSVGSGDTIQEKDLIRIQYTGRLMSNGNQFGEGNIKIMVGEPDRVMLGWQRGIEGMKVGGKRTLRIPPRLGYGRRGSGDAIPPNSDLEFDIEITEKDDGALAPFLYKTGIGMNVKTGGLLFFIVFLAVSPFIDKAIDQALK